MNTGFILTLYRTPLRNCYFGRAKLTKNMQQIDFNKEEYLSKFKVYQPQTLFEPDLSLIKEGLCPLCFNKLKKPLNRNILLCASPKHAKPFIKVIPR